MFLVKEVVLKKKIGKPEPKETIKTKRSHIFIKIQPNEEELLQHKLNLKQI